MLSMHVNPITPSLNGKIHTGCQEYSIDGYNNKSQGLWLDSTIVQ